jgi:hypothetical protein
MTDLAPEPGKQRQNELRYVQVRFGHQRAQGGRLPQPARTHDGKSGQIHNCIIDFTTNRQKPKIGNVTLQGTGSNRRGRLFSMTCTGRENFFSGKPMFFYFF